MNYNEKEEFKRKIHELVDYKIDIMFALYGDKLTMDHIVSSLSGVSKEAAFIYINLRKQ